jgi:rsbT antagonist protein RsbS
MSGVASIIKVGPTLIVTIPEDIGDEEATTLQESINEQIERTNATGLLVDISSLETVDSFLGRLLNEIAIGGRLLGADTIVSGMRPAVAMTLIELGLQLKGVRTALDSERGLAMLGLDVRSRQQS